MITEDYVSFEVAKLLKEKGFEGHSIITIYDEDAANAYVKELIEKHLPYSSDDPKLKEFYYIKPTLQMAMKWLREIHRLHITIYSCSQESWMYRITKPHQKLEDGEYGEDFNSYEEAVEAAILYCLENLI